MLNRGAEWRARISQPTFDEMVDEFDIKIPMRDGVELAADLHRPRAEGEFPALLAFQPFGKEHEELGRHFPHQRRPSPLWDGALEAGDTAYFVSRGYVHVVVDARGTGASGGELPGAMGAGGPGEGSDIHDVVEWVARQPWCSGSVGMVGISYLAAVQLIGAAHRPPHLKAIFPEGGHYDGYRLAYHGGILWHMPRAAMRGRGGDSSFAVLEPQSLTRKRLGEEEFRAMIEERLQDPDVAYYPNYHQLLKYPELDPIWLDYILNHLDGEFWQGEGTLEERAQRVEIPVHLGVQLGRGWQLDETLNVFCNLQGVKQLEIRPGPPMQERPFHEFHAEIVRWYDHWLKGNDTGMLDEPTIKVHLQGSDEIRHFDQWPPPTNWTGLYLRPMGKLSEDPEPLERQDVPPDGFYQAPQRVTQTVGGVEYLTPPLPEPVVLIGSGSLHLFAEIDTDDTNWIIRLADIAPDGSEDLITTGWLKASHRKIDEDRSQPWDLHHPHDEVIPVVPGEITHYPIRIFPMACRLAAGHRLKLEIKSVEDPASVNVMLPPESGHLNSGRATTHKIYRDREWQSHLILPVVSDRE